MRGNVPAFDIRRADTLEEALATLAETPGAWKPFAGGTDIMVVLEAGHLEPGRYLSIWGLDELRGITVGESSIRLGALTTYTDVREHPQLWALLPNLCEAARLSGAIAIQNRGTLGGNIANASPAADSPPALLAYDATLELTSVRGTRRVAYDGFHSGYKAMDLMADELITAIEVPKPAPGTFHYYRKVGTRMAQAISKVCLAAVGKVDSGVITHCRVGVGAVAPVPLHATATEAVLVGERLDDTLIERAVAAMAEEVTPIDDVRSNAHYRERIAANMVGEFLRKLAGAAGV